MTKGRLYLIPWHIGDSLDLTFNAVSLVRRIGFLLVEDVEAARRELTRLGADPDAKTLVVVPRHPDAELTARVLSALTSGDVGLLSAGGIPAFVDPGAWLVAELRRRGERLVATAGASALSTMLSLSGVEWRAEETPAFTFTFFLDAGEARREERKFIELVRRREPVFVFLPKVSVPRCLALLEPLVGARPVTLFFDLTKRPVEEFPMSGEVRTRGCAQWRRDLDSVPWDRVGDVALMVGP